MPPSLASQPREISELSKLSKVSRLSKLSKLSTWFHLCLRISYAKGDTVARAAMILKAISCLCACQVSLPPPDLRLFLPSVLPRTFVGLSGSLVVSPEPASQLEPAAQSKACLKCSLPQATHCVSETPRAKDGFQRRPKCRSAPRRVGSA